MQRTREPRATWWRAAGALAVLLAAGAGLAVTALTGSPDPAGASVDASTISTPLTSAKPPPSTSPPSTSRPTTPRTTVVSRSTVPATSAPRPTTPPASSFVTPTPSGTYVSSTSTSTSTTSTTLAGIESQVSAPVATVPLVTKASNGHVDPVLGWLSGGGFLVALLIVAARLFVTRPGGLDRAPFDR